MKTFDTMIITEIGNERDDPTVNTNNAFYAVAKRSHFILFKLLKMNLYVMVIFNCQIVRT